MPFATLGQTNQFHPGMVCRILFNNIVRTIGRTVTDDNPLDRPGALRYDRFNGELDEIGFVARRRDEYEGRMLQHAQKPFPDGISRGQVDVKSIGLLDASSSCGAPRHPHGYDDK